MIASRSSAQVSCGPGATSCSIRWRARREASRSALRPVLPRVVGCGGLEHRQRVLGRRDPWGSDRPGAGDLLDANPCGAARAGARARASRAHPRPRRAADARRPGAGRARTSGMATTAPRTSAASSHHSHEGASSSAASSAVLVVGSTLRPSSDGSSDASSSDSSDGGWTRVAGSESGSAPARWSRPRVRRWSARARSCRPGLGSGRLRRLVRRRVGLGSVGDSRVGVRVGVGRDPPDPSAPPQRAARLPGAARRAEPAMVRRMAHLRARAAGPATDHCLRAVLDHPDRVTGLRTTDAEPARLP